jgi:ferredoxin-thioredoxin reductase catalytic subunit
LRFGFNVSIPERATLLSNASQFYNIINMDDLEELQLRVNDFCREKGYRLAPDAEPILRDMVKFKQMTGDFYCPCQAQRSPETVCICQPVRNGLVDLMGACFCNLILSDKDIKE